jgi:RimJ/RimL family protein N-acetyltransferase
MYALIETKRLILRPPQSGDEISLNKLINRSQESLKPWLPWSHNTRISTTLKFVERAIGQWESSNQTDFPMVIFHKEDACLIGCSGFNEKSNPSVPFYEPGYWLDTRYTGRGLATEFTTALTRYAFGKLKAKRVQISIQANNEKSINVAKRCGFELEATLRNACVDTLTGKAADVSVFACFDTQNLPAHLATWK